MIPNPIDVAKATAEVFVGQQLWMAPPAVHVTEATVETVGALPVAVQRFLTVPTRIMTAMLNIGLWVLSHLELIFIGALVALLVVLASFLNTGWKSAHRRVADTVGGKRAVDRRRDPEVGGGRAQSHPQNVVQPDGSLCVRGGAREARDIGRRAGAQNVYARGSCRIHNGSKLFEAV